jgi:hypothetical protein
LHQPRPAVESCGTRAAGRPDLPAGPDPTHQRVQPRDPVEHRGEDRRTRGGQEGSLLGAVRRRLERGALRALVVIPFPVGRGSSNPLGLRRRPPPTRHPRSRRRWRKRRTSWSPPRTRTAAPRPRSRSSPRSR